MIRRGVIGAVCQWKMVYTARHDRSLEECNDDGGPVCLVIFLFGWLWLASARAPVVAQPHGLTPRVEAVCVQLPFLTCLIINISSTSIYLTSSPPFLHTTSSPLSPISITSGSASALGSSLGGGLGVCWPDAGVESVTLGRGLGRDMMGPQTYWTSSRSLLISAEVTTGLTFLGLSSWRASLLPIQSRATAAFSICTISAGLFYGVL